jgi:hypothetical protein
MDFSTMEIARRGNCYGGTSWYYLHSAIGAFRCRIDSGNVKDGAGEVVTQRKLFALLFETIVL